MHSWSSLVEGDEGSCLLNCQSNLVVALDALSLLFLYFYKHNSLPLGRYKPSSPISCPAPLCILGSRDNTTTFGSKQLQKHLNACLKWQCTQITYQLAIFVSWSFIIMSETKVAQFSGFVSTHNPATPDLNTRTKWTFFDLEYSIKTVLVGF